MEQFDVVIIGAGLAGLQCARLLSKGGHRVLLVDHKEKLTQSVHTTGIFVRRTLEDFDLPADCLGPAVRHVTLHSPARRSLELSSPHDEFRIGRMGKLYQRFLEESLRNGAEWMPATRYAEHSLLKSEVVVRLEGKRGSRWIKARYIVGADGANSRVARQLQLDTNTQWIVGVEDVLKGVPLNGPPRLHCFLDRELAPGYLAWIANDGEEAHIGVGGYASMLISCAPHRFVVPWETHRFESVYLPSNDADDEFRYVVCYAALPMNRSARRDAAGAVSPLTREARSLPTAFRPLPPESSRTICDKRSRNLV